MGNKDADVVGQLNTMLSGLKKFEKEMGKFGENLTTDFSANMEDVINKHTYEGEKKMKVMGKKTTVSLGKDGSWKVVFDDPKEGTKIFKGEK